MINRPKFVGNLAHIMIWVTAASCAVAGLMAIAGRPAFWAAMLSVTFAVVTVCAWARHSWLIRRYGSPVHSVDYRMVDTERFLAE
jgi:hypothetical protein